MTAPNIKLIATDLDGTFLGEDLHRQRKACKRL